MKLVLPVAVALLVLALSLVAHGGKPEEEALIAAAKKLDADFAAAMNKGDAAALSALYWNSPDMVLYPPGLLEVKGHAALGGAISELVKETKGAKFEMIETNYRAAGDVVYSWGKWKFTFSSEDGKPQEMVGRYTDVKAERDGKWVYLIDHASVPMAHD